MVVVALAGCGPGPGAHVALGEAIPNAAAPSQGHGSVPTLDTSTDIAGPDADRNGVRDDIDAWIAAQPVVPAQKSALVQTARALQAKLLVDPGDRAALQRVGEMGAAAVNCRSIVFKPAWEPVATYGRRIEAMTANTRERARRYMDYIRARSGSATELPSGNTCDP